MALWDAGKINCVGSFKLEVQLRADADILEYFKSRRSGCQFRINEIFLMEVNRNLTGRQRATTRKRVAA